MVKLKIIVAISRVPDTAVNITLDANSTSIDETSVPFTLNPYDEWYALARAAAFKEEIGGGVEIVLVSVGNESAEPILRRALAIAGDRAIRIPLETEDPMNVAYQISHVAKQEQADLVLGGKETISYNGGVVMAMVAEYLDAVYFNEASILNFQDGYFTGCRLMAGEYQIVKAVPTVVASCAVGIASQRTPSIKGILAAKKKNIDIVQPKPFEDNVSIQTLSLVPPKPPCRVVGTTEELYHILKHIS